jgi:hypothetical protein
MSMFFFGEARYNYEARFINTVELVVRSRVLGVILKLPSNVFDNDGPSIH